VHSPNAPSFLPLLIPLVEFVFTVPVSWTSRSNYLMEKMIIDALRSVNFGIEKATGLPFSMFMVNEAEASAMQVVNSEDIGLKVKYQYFIPELALY
jgi:hypothetical protein